MFGDQKTSEDAMIQKARETLNSAREKNGASDNDGPHHLKGRKKGRKICKTCRKFFNPEDLKDGLCPPCRRTPAKVISMKERHGECLFCGNDQFYILSINLFKCAICGALFNPPKVGK